MNLPPWETHDPLCPNRRPTIAFPNSACSGCRAVVAARAEGYARGLIEGDSGGRREGYRIGYDTAWSLSAAEIAALRACEARVREEESAAATQDCATHQRDARDIALAQVRAEVEALPHSLECVTRDTNYDRPCNCLRGDAIAALWALEAWPVHAILDMGGPDE